MEAITRLDGNYKLEIVPGKSIKAIDFKGLVEGKSASFNMFDLAEYDSYNLSYLGYIVGITEKTVTIVEEHDFDKWKGIKAGTYTKKHEYDKPHIHRLKLNEFAWRNYDFNLQQTRKDNHETSMYI